MNQQLIKRYKTMPFMLRYAELFGKADIMQKILPKTINTPEELEFHYPTLLTEGSSQASKDMQLTKIDEYKLADFNAVNKVSQVQALTIDTGNRRTYL